jgi:hypothetical protein
MLFTPSFLAANRRDAPEDVLADVRDRCVALAPRPGLA